MRMTNAIVSNEVLTSYFIDSTVTDQEGVIHQLGNDLQGLTTERVKAWRFFHFTQLKHHFLRLLGQKFLTTNIPFSCQLFGNFFLKGITSLIPTYILFNLKNLFKNTLSKRENTEGRRDLKICIFRPTYYRGSNQKAFKKIMEY